MQLPAQACHKLSAPFFLAALPLLASVVVSLSLAQQCTARARRVIQHTGALKAPGRLAVGLASLPLFPLAPWLLLWP